MNLSRNLGILVVAGGFFLVNGAQSARADETTPAPQSLVDFLTAPSGNATATAPTGTVDPLVPSPLPGRTRPAATPRGRYG